MLHKKRILIVDDEQINLEFFEVMLGKLGFEVFKAENGQEALNAIRKVHPDLLLMDNMMPVLSGWEVIKVLKKSTEFAKYADIPIIIFSALDDVQDKVEALELGADDYITKPFKFAEVLARIRAVLRTHEILRQIENRDKRIVIGDKMLNEMSGAVSIIEKHINDIIASEDLTATKSSASEVLDILTKIHKNTDTLIKENNSLLNESKDINAMKRDYQ